jgi:hypothetical protein
MNTINNGKKIRTGVLLAGWLLALLAAPATVMGAGCTETEAPFSLLVDASSSCAAANMFGCTMDSSDECTIRHDDGREIVITLTSGAVGSVPAEPLLVSWTATGPAVLGDGLVDLGIIVGATHGGSCAWNYNPGARRDSGMGFQKTNGSYQKVNDIFFCSDFIAPPPAEALVIMSKTVMPEGGDCSVDGVEVLEINAGDEVEYCFAIRNVGLGDAGDVTLSDPDVEFTPGDNSLELGDIISGEQLGFNISDPVVIAESGEIINTATIDWVNVEVSASSTGTASDTATVISITAVEACPEQYQDLVDGTIGAGTEDFFGFAALYDPNAPSRVSLCAPSGSAGTECVIRCDLKPACVTDPTADECVAPNYQCEPSGAWSVGSYLDSPTPCVDQSGSGGTPYCWELAADPDKLCNYQPVQVINSNILLIEQIHINPFCFFITTNIDGKSTTVQHCF